MVNKILFQAILINKNKIILSSKLSGNDNYRFCLILFTGEQISQFICTILYLNYLLLI